jgi:hypothetical protein
MFPCSTLVFFCSQPPQGRGLQRTNSSLAQSSLFPNDPSFGPHSQQSPYPDHHHQQQRAPQPTTISPATMNRDGRSRNVGLTDNEAAHLALLLSKQEADFGINMYDALRPSDEPEIQRLVDLGYTYEQAILHIYENRFAHLAPTPAPAPAPARTPAPAPAPAPREPEGPGVSYYPAQQPSQPSQQRSSQQSQSMYGGMLQEDGGADPYQDYSGFDTVSSAGGGGGSGSRGGPRGKPPVVVAETIPASSVILSDLPTASIAVATAASYDENDDEDIPDGDQFVVAPRSGHVRGHVRRGSGGGSVDGGGGGHVRRGSGGGSVDGGGGGHVRRGSGGGSVDGGAGGVRGMVPMNPATSVSRYGMQPPPMQMQMQMQQVPMQQPMQMQYVPVPVPAPLQRHPSQMQRQPPMMVVQQQQQQPQPALVRTRSVAPGPAPAPAPMSRQPSNRGFLGNAIQPSYGASSSASTKGGAPAASSSSASGPPKALGAKKRSIFSFVTGGDGGGGGGPKAEKKKYKESDVRAITDMGYAREQAVWALLQSDNNLAMAIESLCRS